ncbi:MAG: hypothetical protein MJ209_04230 [archaeon]|nr:hypothetical protein [archaeon]
MYLFNTTLTNNVLNSINKILDSVYNINGIVETDSLCVIANNTYTSSYTDSIFSIYYPLVIGEMLNSGDIILPSVYDLRNVEGTSYVTDVRD